jgi:hypothetical protein
MNRTFEEWLLARRWSWIPVTILICVVFGTAFIDNFTPTKLQDFVQEWASARNHFAGFPIYEDQQITLRHHMNILRDTGLERNAHPPTSVLLALPFAAFDYWHAIVAWNVLSLVCLAWSLWLILRELQVPLSGWSIFPIVCPTLVLGVCGILRTQIHEGQLNLVLLLLCTGCWVASRRARPGLAGVLLSAATAVKLYPGFLFLYFVLRKQWRTVAIGLLSFLGWTLLTAGILGVDAYRSYLFDVLPTLSHFRSGWPGVSFHCFFSKLFDPYPPGQNNIPLWLDPQLARLATLSCNALVVALTAWTVWRARTPRQCDHAFALCLTTMLLVSPLAWDHYLLLLLLPVVLLWTALPAQGFPRWSMRIVTVMLCIHSYCYWFMLLCDPRKDWAREVAQPWQTLTALSFHFYALLGLFVLVLRAAWRRDEARALQPQIRHPDWLPRASPRAVAG